MGDTGAYISAVLWNFWTISAGVLLAIEPVIRWFWAGYDAWAGRRLTPERRRQLAHGAALLAFVFANYLAYHDVKEQLRAAQENPFSEQQNERRLAVKALIGNGIRDGEKLLDGWQQKDADSFQKEATQWVNRINNLVSDAYGNGEAASLMNDAGIVNYTNGKRQHDIKNWIANRIDRLNDIIKRSGSIPIQKNFDPAIYNPRDN